ncbi:hypothetical protein V8G54_018381 [Vigna mungo]|uniref:Uncharacterized protein n=1 Tax=Vigna mungo TaxID=3915 RepID=A0AAQ3N9U4_VIGMU
MRDDNTSGKSICVYGLALVYLECFPHHSLDLSAGSNTNREKYEPDQSVMSSMRCYFAESSLAHCNQQAMWFWLKNCSDEKGKRNTQEITVPKRIGGAGKREKLSELELCCVGQEYMHPI